MHERLMGVFNFSPTAMEYEIQLQQQRMFIHLIRWDTTMVLHCHIHVYCIKVLSTVILWSIDVSVVLFQSLHYHTYSTTYERLFSYNHRYPYVPSLVKMHLLVLSPDHELFFYDDTATPTYSIRP